MRIVLFAMIPIEVVSMYFMIDCYFTTHYCVYAGSDVALSHMIVAADTLHVSPNNM